MRNITILKRDIEILKEGFDVEIIGNFERIIIKQFPLPENFDPRYVDILLVILNNFPLTPPQLFLPKYTKIKFPNSDRWGQFHSFSRKHILWQEGWGWMCFSTTWDPNKDGLITFLQKIENPLALVRADREIIK